MTMRECWALLGRGSGVMQYVGLGGACCSAWTSPTVPRKGRRAWTVALERPLCMCQCASEALGSPEGPINSSHMSCSVLSA